MIKKRNVNKTGLEGLDKIFEGGIPEGHVVLVQGEAGSGKTMLSMQWLFLGWITNNEPGIYIAVTETYQKALKNIQDIDFFNPNIVNKGNIRFTDLRSMIQIMAWDNRKITRDDVEELVDRIKKLVIETKAKRLVIDSITAVGYKINDNELFRYMLFRLGTVLDTINCTAFLTSEGKGKKSTFSIEDFISDGIIQMEQVPGEQRLLRYLNILKMRGVNYRSGQVVFEIDKNGITVFPKIPVDRIVAKTNFDKRKSTGVRGLDKMMGGGYPEGHVILLTGNTGSGKTTLGMQFLVEGLKKEELSLYVNLEEPLEQVRKTAEAHGWDFERYEKKGLLNFISPDLIDTYPDKFLYQIIDSIDKNNINRILIDSISSLPSSGMSDNKVRETLLQLNSALKRRGVTTLMTFLSTNLFSSEGSSLLGATSASDLRLSSLNDGIILLRYLEKEQKVVKVLNILKMRGIAHSKDIREFTICRDGIMIGKKISRRLMNGQ